ncbi:MAG: MOSC domain-containing protein [Okeania sp. SIO1H5]|uniref:MOSC domain-containing protein n=1 Tax=Okeania sp. SIO1H5 TaxID=2607777 RepID=UPI0013BE0153|nr:MOSC N-terminal beta barrel domain-containing protein [Okeania sp. SIO1H5]NET23838.1 MOSC domain-containing protein [Okeania sp. SIO1H5]
MKAIQPIVGRLRIYPIKSLDGCDQEQVKISSGGAFEWDRRYALVDAKGKFVNAKRFHRIHHIRTQFLWHEEKMVLSIPFGDTGESQSISAPFANPSGLQEPLSHFFGFQVSLRENISHGFPDDTQANGPTVVSRSSLETLCQWFPTIDFEQMIHRFRPNLILDAAPTFYEDHLYATESSRAFRVGQVEMYGSNPCARCVVPTRHPHTGQRDAAFQRDFMRRRKENMPPTIAANRFNHYYRFALNTNISPTEAGKQIHLGDRVNAAENRERDAS